MLEISAPVLESFYIEPCPTVLAKSNFKILAELMTQTQLALTLCPSKLKRWEYFET